MAEKKDYQDVLIIIDTVASIVTTGNGLVKIGHRTEDTKLKAALEKLAREVHMRGGPTQKIHLGNISTTMSLGKAADQIKKYCQAVLASAKPQWQILAEQHGWIPPTPNA
ncbi:hypothetical protein [Cupriavidus sp. amp6]|uniref:hypothetical protein n=1 Tax=Cupriavidus sp. amp6 TaxID=388051 RepID=UPI00040F8B25|nr:hypothetical protein [Cupriavidus sp. amp6]